MNDENQAVMENEYMVRLNYEAFFFATKDEKKLFSKSPTKFCGALTDPVSKQRFVPVESSPSYDLEDHVYFFLSEENQEMFAAMPDSFSRAGFKMIKMKNRMMGEDLDAQE